ncbi:MAG: FAD-dependent oxidoreductase [Verrucomicrobia bacterium]|nr:FAD-dependent oxidoreductase [Verrucomicrobiota bacterium]
MEKGEAPLWSCRETHTLKGPSWGDWMELESRVRCKAFRRGQLLSADGIEAFSGERLEPGLSFRDAEAAELPISACTALKGTLWVLGWAANISPQKREQLKRPDTAWVWGEALAKRMAVEVCTETSLSSTESKRSLSAQIVTDSIQLCHADAQASSPLPDSDKFHEVRQVDVLVVGGGTGGAPAALAAARAGADTLVAEFLSGLGGVGTLGLIGRYWFGVREGFTAEVDAGARKWTTRDYQDGSWDVEAKMHWYHTEIHTAGANIWYKTMIAGALRKQDRIVGAILCCPRGRIAVLAGCTVDATGSAEVAAAAGAPTVSVGEGHLAMQGTGLPGRNPGKDYTNTDYEFIDDTSDQDLASAHVTAREKFKHAFDAGQLVDSRERRRIVGDIEVSPMDIRLTRRFPDTICRARSNFDTHGFTIHPLFLIVDPGHDPVDALIPLRALLPAGLEGILVTGLGISAHRDAMPVIRMQADVQNQGYAAGLIAAMAKNTGIRSLPLEEIQQRLADLGILTPDLVSAKDSFPLSDEEIATTLIQSVENPNLIDRLFTLPEMERVRRLKEAFNAASDLRAQRHFAFVLAIHGDSTGAGILAHEN